VNIPFGMSTQSTHSLPGKGLLEGKVAVIYGASGGVGSSVAKAFAREGARVFLVGRRSAPLDDLAREISKAGGSASASQVDALDSKAVEEHLQKVLAEAGRLDVSFNLIGTNVGIGTPLVKLTDEKFTAVAFDKVRSYFITMTAAARIMEKQGNGVILGLTAPNARLPRVNMGGFSVCGAAIEALCRQLALEAGPQGVRVVCLRSGGTPDNPIIHEVFEYLAKQKGVTFEEFARSEGEITALKRLPLTTEVANAAALIASDYASTITATVVNASSGELVD
jgi:NAD(P)-dependent dehydrogenase (short-subunit alcohol dehydrogenase family)